MWENENRRILGNDGQSVLEEFDDLEEVDGGLFIPVPQQASMGQYNNNGDFVPYSPPEEHTQQVMMENEARAPMPKISRGQPVNEVRSRRESRNRNNGRGGKGGSTNIREVDSNTAQVSGIKPYKLGKPKAGEQCIGMEEYDSSKDPLLKYSSKYKSAGEERMKKIEQQVREKMKIEMGNVCKSKKHVVVKKEPPKPVSETTKQKWANIK